MKFNSQICTTVEQSQRLLKLGLKKETADCCYLWRWESDSHFLYANSWKDIHSSKSDIPAWSLHRLIEIVPEYFANTKLPFRVEAVKWLAEQEGNVYDNLIVLVADCIKNGILNKEYLV